MTAEALSPPNPAESLRDRLIREGKIVPAQGSTSSSSALMTARERLLDEIEKLNELLRENNLEIDRENLIKDHYLKIFKYINDSFAINDSDFCFNGKKVVINYYLALSFKHLRIIYSALSDFGKLLSDRVAMLRSGFFFAFKENMKNTP